MADEPLTSEAIIKKLQELTQGLFYISESDYPLDVVCLKPEANGEMLEADILKLANKQTNTPIKKEEVSRFFRNMVKEEVVGAENAIRFLALKAFMEENLADLAIYKVGETEVEAFALGKLKSGELAGVKTIIIQTRLWVPPEEI